MLLLLRGKHMRLIFIRHAEPDYGNDCLTERGIKEAECLNRFLKNIDLGEVYSSPLGRAFQTAQIATEGRNADIKLLGWLEEIGKIVRRQEDPELKISYSKADEGPDGNYIPWDVKPFHLTKHPEYFDPYNWRTSPAACFSNLPELYDERTKRLDDLLAEKGYIREGLYYKTEQGCHDTLTFFTHLGVSNLLISHLINTSPFTVWHGFSIPTSSVTIIHTEEREKGNVLFRIRQMGDISHLNLQNIEPSFNARFCEVYEDDTRH
ncbi:MAG: histidine phosphatase family protein [Erysipelotrichaceae bacterium]|nr:histidine phosphatase family protein [Erysipelotrichaceae bacterium]